MADQEPTRDVYDGVLDGKTNERFLREIMRKNFDPRQYHRESRRRHKLPPIEGPYMSGGKG